MTMKGGNGSKTAATAKNKGRLKNLKSSKSVSGDRRSSADSDIDGAKIMQNQRKKIMAVNAFEQEKSNATVKNTSKAVKVNKSLSRKGPKEGKIVHKSAVTKTAGKVMVAASKSSAMAAASSTTSNNTGTKNVNATGAKPRMFVRHNSTPAVIPLDKKVVTRKSALKSSPEAGRPQRKKSASAENLPAKSTKSVRIDDNVEVRQFRQDGPNDGDGDGGGKQTQTRRPRTRTRNPPLQKAFPRRASLESSDESPLVITQRRRKKESFFPRRRFSNSAIEPIREILEEIEEEEKAAWEKERAEQSDDDGDDSEEGEFKELSRNDQHKRLQKKGKKKARYKDGIGWIGLKSLTGANVSGWKFQDSFYGILSVKRAPATDTAWGRRVYDQYEIDSSVDKQMKSIYEYDETEKNDRRGPQELGLWDLLFSRDVVPKLDLLQRWDPHYEDKQKFIKKLKIDVTEIKEDDVAITEETKESPINQFKIKFMNTGDYLRPHDMKYCIEKTNFNEEQIIDWFRRFKRDCPDGRLTRDNLRTLFRQALPDGDADKFSRHIMRIFDSDGNDFLDFKEFLLAMDIATCETEESKLAWAFKLFDNDNSGYLDVTSMVDIMETLESIENKKLSESACNAVMYDEAGNPEDALPSAEQRAKDLFEALDRDKDGVITMEDFVSGYMERNELMAKQDALEQKRKLNCLILKGPLVPNSDEVLKDRWAFTISSLIRKRVGVEVESDDLESVSLKGAATGEEVDDPSARWAFVRFVETDKRMEVWAGKNFARRNGLGMEEWLTKTRSKIFAKCKDLKSKGKIKDVTTKNGDIIVLVDVKQKTSYLPCDDGGSGGNTDEGDVNVDKVVADAQERPPDELRHTESPFSPPLTLERESPSTIIQKMVVVNDEEFSNLLKITKGIGDEDDIA